MKSLPEWLQFIDAQWDAIGRELEKGSQLVRIDVDAAGELAVDYTLAEAQLNASLLEVAIREFAREKKWPPLTEEQNIHLSARIWIAARTIKSLGDDPVLARDSLPPAPIGESDEAFIIWLLIDVWNQRGIQDFARRLRESFPFKKMPAPANKPAVGDGQGLN